MTVTIGLPVAIPVRFSRRWGPIRMCACFVSFATGGGDMYVVYGWKTGVLLVIQKIPYDYDYDDVDVCIFDVDIFIYCSI